MPEELPIAVIGAGPVGLAAAAHIVGRGLKPVVFERSSAVGAALRSWGHVKVFTPWSYNIDAAAQSLLAEGGWTAPDPDALPTGGEIIDRYLAPLAAHAAIAPALRLEATVTGISRVGTGKLGSDRRASTPFAIQWRDRDGDLHRTLARAVIDASGTWNQPNPLGVDGLPVSGEAAAGDRIHYGLPDVLGRDRATFVGERVLVVGGGHSAINVALDLLRLRKDEPKTSVRWALRRESTAREIGRGCDDELPARGALGLSMRRAIDDGRLKVVAPFAVESLDSDGGALRVRGRRDGRHVSLDVDRLVVATGFRPDLGILRELRVDLDPAVEAPRRLAPLIDPNLHSCITVPQHGVDELAHPEPGFYIVGSKSYGRAPTFLMKTGYAQVRAVVARIAGGEAVHAHEDPVAPEASACCAGGAPARAAN